MAVKYNGGIIVASDSRASAGMDTFLMRNLMHSFLGQWVANRVTDKLELLYDRIYVCRSGSAADTQTIARYTRYYLDSFKYLALFLEVCDPRVSRTNFDMEPTVTNAATLLKSLIYNNKDMLQAGMIVAGYDDTDGFAIYSIPIDGSLIKTNVALGGMVWS